MEKTLTTLLTHQAPECVLRMWEHWRQERSSQEILVLYGGTRENFSKLGDINAVFVEDQRLRTRDHCNEFQSYIGVFQEISRYLKRNPNVFSWVFFAEFDVLPLRPFPELEARYLETLHRQNADAIFRLIYECQGSGQDVYQQHARLPGFHDYWQSMTVRPDPRTVLWALTPGSFWKAEVILDIADIPEPFPIYFEIWLPTVTHHRGWRVRPMEDNKFKIHGGGALDDQIAAAREEGCHVIHPVKRAWLSL
ncbi:MAG: hypothetical protein ACOYNN_18780 [Terrimicrobiaceae bacterium]